MKLAPVSVRKRHGSWYVFNRVRTPFIAATCTSWDMAYRYAYGLADREVSR